jgi:amino acid permease
MGFRELLPDFRIDLFMQRTQVISTLIYAVAGAIGYLMFGESVSDEV